MRLFKADASPFVRKVMVLLHETGQLGEVETIDVSVSPVAPDAALNAANPLGKIPALARDEGPTLYDSRVICRFLDDKGGGRLYPQDRLWETLTLEATADGIMEAAVLIVYEGRLRPEAHRSQDWTDAQWTKISRATRAISDRWMSHLSGPLDMGQIAVGCALGYLDFRHPDRNWRKDAGALDDWFAVFSERPAMQATRPG